MNSEPLENSVDRKDQAFLLFVIEMVGLDVNEFLVWTEPYLHLSVLSHLTSQIQIDNTQ